MKRSLDPKERLSCAICLVKFSSLESVFSKRLALSSARASLVMACQNKSICSHSWQREAGRNQTLQRKWKFHEISMDFWFHSSVSCVLVCIKNLQTFQTQHAPFAPPLLQSLWTTSPEQRNKTQLKWRQTAQSLRACRTLGLEYHPYKNTQASLCAPELGTLSKRLAAETLAWQVVLATPCDTLTERCGRPRQQRVDSSSVRDCVGTAEAQGTQP